MYLSNSLCVVYEVWAFMDLVKSYDTIDLHGMWQMYKSAWSPAWSPAWSLAWSPGASSELLNAVQVSCR